MLRRSTAILLALLVLVSSTGFSITAHLCHGRAVSYSLLGRPADCGAAEESAPAEHCDHSEITGSDTTSCQSPVCCTNESRFFKGIEPATKVSGKPVAPSVYMVPENSSIPALFTEAIFLATKVPLHYCHPRQTRDWLSWLCVFRI